jgi:hypothetical protein
VRVNFGTLSVEIEPQKGSTFHFTFKLGLTDVVPERGAFDARAIMPEPSMLLPPMSPAPARRLRILLAEDNPVNQKLATRLLERNGHSDKNHGRNHHKPSMP